MADKKTNKLWAAEKRNYAKTAAMLTGRTIKVMDVDVGMEDQLGYTSSDNTIHLAYDHPAMDGLTAIEKAAFRKGVFAHEAMHQVFTNFRATEIMLNKVPKHERQILATFFNILEDPAIENYASTVIGGNLLHCLRFTIAHIYKGSPNIEAAETAMGQFVSALIQFGDMGVLKGHFTFPEAQTIFSEAAPIFYEGINEPVCKKRLKLAKEIFEMSRSLWAEEAEMQKMLDELASMIGDAMKGSGTGNDGNPGLLSKGDKKNKRRKITIKKVSKEEYDKMKGDSSGTSSGSLPDGDITVYTCDEAEKEEGKGGSGESISIPGEKKSDDESGEKPENGSSSSGEKSEEEGEESEKGGSNGSEKEDSSEKSSESSSGEKGENSEDSSDGEGDKNPDKNSEKTSEETGENKPQKPSSSNDKDAPFRATGEAKEVQMDYNGEIDDGEGPDDDNTVDNEEYVLSQEDIDYIKKEQKSSVADYEAAEIAERDDFQVENFDITSAVLGSRSCLNYKITYSDSDRAHLEESYSNLMERIGPGIRNLTNQLIKIFQNDAEEKLYKGTGRVNINRMNNGRVTSRVFDKRSNPTDKSDLAVMLVIDESGSMYSYNKCDSARESAIALAEVFNRLHIPIYIMGFTADTQRYDIVHNHYVTWKNTASDRLKLLNITARANNCDGYSIRYATQLMKKSKAKNKLMIIISDGQPAANGYSRNGVQDTKLAIKEAKKVASVLGVAVGDDDTNVIHYMYESDFLHISNTNDLFSGLARKIKHLIRNWD